MIANNFWSERLVQLTLHVRDLSRIFEMSVQSSNCKISAHLDLATQLIQIFKPITFKIV